MPYYEGQTESTTQGTRGGGRQSDLLMQELGTSVSNGEQGGSGSNDFTSLGFDNNSTTSSAPLVFDESTDTRMGNPRRRRGNGKKLGTASNQFHASERPHAAGMIRNDQEVARRQQIIQGVVSDQVVGSRPRVTRPTVPARPGRPASQAATPRQSAGNATMGRQQQQVGPVTGISLNNKDATADTENEEPRFKAHPLTSRIRELRGHRFINPITFMRDNGGGIETFGVWLYEYRHLFIILTVLALLVGMLFNRYISFGAGIVMILIGMWLDKIDDDNDTFIVYLCGFVTALLPFVISA